MYKHLWSSLSLIFTIPSSAYGASFEYYSSYEYFSASKVQYLALGVRAKFRHATIELSNGIKKADRPEKNANSASNGTLVGIHIFPFHSTDSRDRFVLSAIHLSDLFRGEPFNDQEEPVDHFLGAGYALSRDNYEIDLLIGKESHDCSLDRECEFTTQIKASIRYIF